MKKLFLTVFAAVCTLGASAWWNPQNLNPNIIKVYEIMAVFAREGYNDALSELTYDCYPTGERTMSRRFQVNIHEHPGDSAMISAELEHAVKSFDQMLASLPNDRRIRKISKDADGNITRLYSNFNFFQSENGEPVMSFDANASNTEGAMLKVIDGDIEMAQMFRVKSPMGPPADGISLSDRMSRIFGDMIKEYPSASTRKVEFQAEPRNSGLIRLRDVYANSDEVTIGTVLTIKGKEQGYPAWEQVQSEILAMVGEDYDVSITYVRSRRLITVQGHDSKTLLAATYKDGNCYVFNGGYFGDQPFLPSNWANAVAVRGNVSYYESTEVSPDEIEGEWLK